MGDFSNVNPVFGSAVDFGLNMLASDIAANRQLSHSKEFFDYTFNKQNQRQDFLNFNAATIQKQSLRNAGLSAASLNASPFSANVASGSGITGSDRMAEVSLFSNMLAAKQLDIQDKLADADVRLKESEAARNEKDLSWIDRLNDARVKVDEANAQFLKGQDSRAEELQKYVVDSAVANLDLLRLDKSYKELTNDALNKSYDFNGKKVKGSEIPNFEKLYNLELAKKTLDVAKYNATTNRRAVDGDWKKLLTNEFGKPLVDYLKNSGDSLLESIGQTIAGILDDLADSDGSPVENESYFGVD